MYPNDDQFEETTIAKVSEGSQGWSIVREDGFSFFIPNPSDVVPAIGMNARFYGKGIGHVVRGLFLDGQKVFYRTEVEEKELHEIETFGADAAEWLKRWDEGRIVWSIEMGGLGPGYEQCIHITAAEILRDMLATKYEHATWSDKEAWERDRKRIEAAGFANARINTLGLSGAQWGAALSLASHLYQHGPRAVMTDDRVKDRHIQVQRTFPAAA